MPRSVTCLHGVLVRKEVDDLKGVLDDARRHELLTAVASLAHQSAAEALHDGALHKKTQKNTWHRRTGRHPKKKIRTNENRRRGCRAGDQRVRIDQQKIGGME